VLDDGVEILYYDMAMVVVVAVEEGRSVAANPGNTGFRIWGCISRITSHFFPCGSRTTRQNLFFSQQICIFVVQ